MTGTAASRITIVRRVSPRSLAGMRVARWEAWSLALLVVAGTSLRTILGESRRTLVYFPDEYLYSALARSVAAAGVPLVRGDSAHLPSLLAPYLMAPPWLIHNPQIAYRAALGWASLWFSLAAVPAWALARRVGVSSRGALVVAVAAVVLPGGVFTTMVLSEPFAYPLFLLTALAATGTLAEPTRRRQALLLALLAALSLVRFQFVVVPCVYLLAAAIHARFRLPAVVRAQWLVALGVGLAGAAATVVGPARIAGAYSALHVYRPSWALVPWALVNLFVLLLSVGWVIAPGSAAGFRGLLRAGGSGRGFAVYAVLATVALLLEAAVFGQREGVVLERYTFYAAPLLVIAFVRGVEAGRTAAFVASGYALAAVAVLLPVVTPYATAEADQAPTLLGLDALAGGGAGGRAFLAAGCAVAVAAVALGMRRRLTAGVAVAVVLVLAAGSTWKMLALRNDPAAAGIRAREVRTYSTPPGSALLAVRTTPPTAVMNTLFWNPNVTRVLVLGGGHSADGYRSREVRPAAAGADGPFVLAPDGIALDAHGRVSARLFRRLPPVLVFGWERADGYLATTSFLFVDARHDGLRVRLRLSSATGTKAVSFSCGALRRVVTVGRAPRDVDVDVPPRSAESCRVDLVRGDVEERGARSVGVRAAIDVTRRDASPAASAASSS